MSLLAIKNYLEADSMLTVESKKDEDGDTKIEMVSSSSCISMFLHTEQLVELYEHIGELLSED